MVQRYVLISEAHTEERWLEKCVDIGCQKMENTWKPKQRSEGSMICRWCGCEFTADYKSLYCTPRCCYAYKNEAVYRKSKLEGLSVREYHFYKQLLKLSSFSQPCKPTCHNEKD